jgi:hypothetical protein
MCCGMRMVNAVNFNIFLDVEIGNLSKSIEVRYN